MFVNTLSMQTTKNWRRTIDDSHLDQLVHTHEEVDRELAILCEFQ